MNNDLIFPILPREGKAPMSRDEQKVQRVSREPTLRPLNDEEKELNAEERDAREKYQKKSKNDEQPSGNADAELRQNTQDEDDDIHDKHLDTFA